MRILKSWLAELTPVPDDTLTLANRLTDIGLEVDDIIRLDQDVEGVLAARVESVKTHPDVDNLSICDIVADGTHAQVVTAAPGVEEGALYPWAPVGASLPDTEVDREEFSGVPSEGMLCSSRELGLTEDAQTLLRLPNQYDDGRNIIEVLELDDPILELDLTPNRPDCLSHLGVARDYAAAEQQDLHDPRPESLPEGSETDVDIVIEQPEDCWSYTGVPINGVTVTSSPFPIQKRILKMGLRPLNNIVDATNYALYEVGHPLHPFDYDRMVSPVTIRRAEKEEPIRTLDGETRELSEEDLVIADKHGAQALAGIMGGLNAQVEQRTERILLEGAYFNPVRIRRTAGRHNVHTEASHRFERGTDPRTYDRCVARCIELIKDDPAHGEDLSVFQPVCVTEQTDDTVRIPFSTEEVPKALGFDPGRDNILQQLDRLGLERDGDDEEFTLTVPSWRRDLERPEDVVEEIVRLHGYERIPTDHPAIGLEETVKPEYALTDRIRTFMIDRGFYEVVTYNFVGSDEHRFVDGDADPLKLENPLSRRTQTMRRSIFDGLLNTLGKHLDEQSSARIFEIGRVFPPKGDQEPTLLSFMLAGDRYHQQWSGTSDVDFYDASGLLRALLESLGFKGVGFSPTSAVGFHDDRTASVVIDGDGVGTVGQLDDDIDTPEDATVLAGEIRIDELSDPPTTSFQEYSTHPIVNRDLDLVVDRAQHVAPMLESIRETAEWLNDITVFDVYEGDPLPEDKKSISFNFSFRHPDRTLGDEEVTEIQDRIFESLRESFGAELRSE